MPSGAAGVAFLQAGGRKGVDRSRQQFDLQPDGSFRTTWTVPRNEGIFHLMVDLLTEGSLSESDADVAPYDANQWGIIYQVGDGESGHGGHHGDDDEEEEEEEEEEEDDRA
jgi:hypothetical protein